MDIYIYALIMDIHMHMYIYFHIYLLKTEFSPTPPFQSDITGFISAFPFPCL